MRYCCTFLVLVTFPVLLFAQQVDNSRASNPVVDFYKQQLTDKVMAQLQKIDWSITDRKTSGGTTLYTIPVVVHSLHSYGPELVTDDAIYNWISDINSVFLKTTPDTAYIIDKFKPIATNTQIAFKLAIKDPAGNPTKGIEHIFSYHTYINTGNQNQVKINQWPQEHYLNIWITNFIWTGTATLGDSYTPFNAAYYPYYDGILLYYQGLTRALGSILFATQLNLPFPCGYSSSCFDFDGIPDTPPCGNSFYNLCSRIYDTICDTPNIQNVMAGSDNCNMMFTYGQGQYMQYVLQLDIGKRDSLVSSNNYIRTGMDQTMPDMLPAPDFHPSWNGKIPNFFFCADQPVIFRNASWNDTITSALWNFSNDATTPTSTSLTAVNNRFHQPGWATVSLSVTGNNTGTATLTKPDAIFVADTNAVNGYGYYQEFSPKGDVNKWPIFNYYQNDFKWHLASRGCYDNVSMCYEGYDARTGTGKETGTPSGDVDDFFTPVFDLSGFTNGCYLNFVSSGAAVTSQPKLMKDKLEIAYSTDLAHSWHLLSSITGADLANAGTVTTRYQPKWFHQWVPRAFSLPASAISPYTIFRFRYFPAADSMGYSTGNNFYIDRFNFNTVPEFTSGITNKSDEVVLQPNPTNSNAYVIFEDTPVWHDTKVVVTDCTGKTVFSAVCNNSNSDKIEIPQTAIATKGLYLVRIISDKKTLTKKLIVD